MPSPTLSGQRILGGEKWFHHPSGSENVAGRRKRQKTHPEADWSRYKNHPAVLRAVRLYKWFQWTGMAVIVGSMCTGYGRQRGPKAFLFFGTAVPSSGCYHKTSRQLVYQYRHALKGLCVLCPQTVEGTSCYCAKHKRQVNEAQRKRYHAKKAKSEVRS